MSYFPTDIPFMSDEELIENGLKKPYKKPEIIDSKDLVPVVRCRDCRYRVDPDKCSHPDGLLRRKNNDFCSYGRRRDSDG